jgi:phage-related protein
MRKILFYKTGSGQNPIEDFLDSLPPKQAQKVAWVLKVVEDLERVPSTYFKKMIDTQDLWEVRCGQGSNVFRLIGFFDGPELVVLAHAFQKKSQKIPKQSIKIAEERKREYFRRKRNE